MGAALGQGGLAKGAVIVAAVMAVAVAVLPLLGALPSDANRATGGGESRGLAVPATGAAQGGFAPDAVTGESAAKAHPPGAPGAAIFLQNQGQLVDGQVRFYSPLTRPAATFYDGEVRLDMRWAGPSSLPSGHGVALSFPGSQAAGPSGMGRSESATNLYMGDRSKWREDVPTFAGVEYIGAFPGVDIEFEARASTLKYEIHVAPGADLRQVALEYRGVEGLSLASAHQLVLRTPVGDLQDTLETSFEGSGAVVDCSYELRSAAVVGFSCPGWDGQSALTIDPVLYASFIGGGNGDFVQSIAFDPSGNYVLFGHTNSMDFPTTAGAWDTVLDGSDDAVVMKFSPRHELFFSTFVGGSSSESANAMALGGDGSIYLAGTTQSQDFPRTPNAFDNTTTSFTDEGFVVHLSGSGALLYSTLLGGSYYDQVNAIAVDAGGSAFVTGQTYSDDFPTTPGAYNRSLGTPEIFVVKLGPSGSTAVYSALVGGTGWEVGRAIALGADGSAYVVGQSSSADFPVTPGVFGSALQGGNDGVVTKVSPGGASLAYSTYLGGFPSEDLTGIVVDERGQAFVVGSSNGDGSPTTKGALNETFNGGFADAILWGLDTSAASLTFGTYLGGAGNEIPTSIHLDAAGSLYVAMSTESLNMPTSSAAYARSFKGNTDGYVAKIARSGDRLLYGTYFGTTDNDQIKGMAIAGADDAWVVGTTSSSAFPTTPDAYDGKLGGFADGFVARLDLRVFNLTVRMEYPRIGFKVDAWNFTGAVTIECPAAMPYGLNVTTPQVDGSVRYLFAGWSDGGAIGHNVTCEADQVVEADFIRQYQVRVTTAPVGLAVVVDGVNASGLQQFWWEENSTHIVEAPSPQPAVDRTVGKRHVFARWSDEGPAAHPVLSEQPATFTASFGTEFQSNFSSDPPGLVLWVDLIPQEAPLSFWWSANSTHVLNVSDPQFDGSDIRTLFGSWSDGLARNRTLGATGPLRLTALFRTEYLVRVETDPVPLDVHFGGASVRAPVEYWWLADSVHTVGTSGAHTFQTTRYVFSQWSDGGLVTHDVSASAHLVLRAIFSVEYWTTVETDPGGFNVIVDGSPRATPHGAWWEAGTRHNIAIVIAPYSTGGERSAFAGWSDGGAQAHNVTADAPATIVANVGKEYLLTVQTIVGRGTCDAASCWYASGVFANFSVPDEVDGLPGTRYLFLGWEGDATQGGNPSQIRMWSPKTVVAVWSHQFFLDVGSEHGRTTGAGWYDGGQNATITINPTEVTKNGTRYRFAGWTGGFEGTADRSKVLMDRPKNVTAQWEPVVEGAAGDFTGLGVGLAMAAAVAMAALLVVRRRRTAGLARAASDAGDHASGFEAGTGTEPSPSGEYDGVGQEGAALAPCPQCGELLETGWAACPRCGLELTWG